MNNKQLPIKRQFEIVKDYKIYGSQLYTNFELVDLCDPAIIHRELGASFFDGLPEDTKLKIYNIVNMHYFKHPNLKMIVKVINECRDLYKNNPLHKWQVKKANKNRSRPINNMVLEEFDRKLVYWCNGS